MPATLKAPKTIRAKKSTNVSPELMRQLRERGKSDRAKIVAERDQIDREGDRVVDEGLADGSIVKVSVLLKGGDDARIVSAIDKYATKHGLQSRSHVVRVALAKLLKLDVPVPKWGWQKGRTRKEA